MGDVQLRRIMLNILDRAHVQRNEAERRLWIARDNVVGRRRELAEAQQSEAIAQREYDRAQDLLNTVWTELRGADASVRDTEGGEPDG